MIDGQMNAKQEDKEKNDDEEKKDNDENEISSISIAGEEEQQQQEVSPPIAGDPNASVIIDANLSDSDYENLSPQESEKPRKKVRKSSKDHLSKKKVCYLFAFTNFFFFLHFINFFLVINQ